MGEKGDVTANLSSQLRVCSFALPRFQILARRSVQFLCLSSPSATFTLQHGGFVTRDWLAAKGLLSV